MGLRLSKKGTIVVHMILCFVSICAILPIVLIAIGSITDNDEIVREGYSFFPRNVNLDAYSYLLKDFQTIGKAYLITILTTAVGTATGLLISAMLAYGLSKPNLKGRKVFSFLVLFTMLFNGGLVPTYLVYTRMFGIKNTLWAQIIPGLLVNGFYVMLLRSYFSVNIPQELYESSRIDGAKETTIFFKICLPLSLPILATVGLMIGLNYWNSWTNGLYYLTKPNFYNIQNVLNNILLDIRYLQAGFFADMSSEIIARMPTDSVIMAIAIIGVIPILFIYPFFQKYYVKGITLGAVKG